MDTDNHRRVGLRRPLKQRLMMMMMMMMMMLTDTDGDVHWCSVVMSSVRPLLYLNKKRWNIGLLVCPERPEVHVPILGSVSQSEHTKVAKNCFNFCQNRGRVYASFQERTADWRKSTFTGVSRPLGSFVASDNRIWQWPLEGSVLVYLPYFTGNTILQTQLIKIWQWLTQEHCSWISWSRLRPV